MLAGGGEPVQLLLRPESVPRYPGTVSLESPLGNLSARVSTGSTLTEPVDVLWVTTKATHLEAALELVPDPSLARMVVTLLNGVDHVPRLRATLGAARVVPGTIAGELERMAPGRFLLKSPFARLGFAAIGEAVLSGTAEILTRFGCACRFEVDELSLLWQKLVMLAPMALNTTASGRSSGELWADPEWAERFEGAAREACTVATALGARVNADDTVKTLQGFPASLRSSMAKDVAAGRAPELDAIAGPILRGGAELGIPVPVTAELAGRVSLLSSRT